MKVAYSWRAGASGAAMLALLGSTAAAETAGAPSPPTVDTVIVTGTRLTGLRAADSAAPIQVLGSQVLQRVGQPDLIQGLAQTVPSFAAESLGGDTGNLTLAARLRGLNPNHTLVLVNGKRRHPTANLHVVGGPYQGAATADLSLIPVDAIERVEVLQDGAAAQYGTDAIAGVVNIILKSRNRGGSLEASGGKYYEGDGKTGALSGNFGAPLGQDGFVNLTGELRFHDFSQRSGIDARLSDSNGALLPGLPASWASASNYPQVNRLNGDAQSTIGNLMYNAGYDTGAVQLYSFGSFGYRRAEAYQNYRLPDNVVASPVLGEAGSYGDPGELIFAPLGFSPKEALRETDFSATVGAKALIGGWNWDLATTYGRNKADIYTRDSANRSLFIDTHFTPTNFYDGSFTSTQWTTNLDLTRAFDVGWAGPLNLAFGGEVRWEEYEITQGDAASTYKEGGQGYPGFQATDAGAHDRTSYAVYGDIATTPLTALQLDLAGRYEHYSDFGDTSIGKLTARYDFSPAFALRGTISTGFRAPTLAEEYYSATNASPIFAFVQLPPNSAAAGLLGIPKLKPEKSKNFSVGFVMHPASNASVTLDAYRIRLDDRIIGTGILLGRAGPFVLSQPVLDAIAAHGNVLDATVPLVGVTLFANAADTRTQGVELMFNYHSNFGDWGSVDWTVAGNYNETSVLSVTPAPAPIANLGSLLTPTTISDLTTAAPREKVLLGGFWTIGRWAVNLRETIYGPVREVVSPDQTGSGPGAVVLHVGTTAITDLDVAYHLTDQVRIAVGANNLFNKKAPVLPALGLVNGATIYNAPITITPWGVNGGYYYTKLTYTF